MNKTVGNIIKGILVLIIIFPMTILAGMGLWVDIGKLLFTKGPEAVITMLTKLQGVTKEY